MRTSVPTATPALFLVTFLFRVDNSETETTLKREDNARTKTNKRAKTKTPHSPRSAVTIRVCRISVSSHPAGDSPLWNRCSAPRSTRYMACRWASPPTTCSPSLCRCPRRSLCRGRRVQRCSATTNRFPTWPRDWLRWKKKPNVQIRFGCTSTSCTAKICAKHGRFERVPRGPVNRMDVWTGYGRRRRTLFATFR